MITVDQLSSRLKEYLMGQIDTMAKTDPMVSFFKPLVTRAMNKNFSKLEGVLSLIADGEGKIDIESILSEMMNSVMTTDPFTIHTSYIGDIGIGGGSIRLSLPLTNKNLVFNQADLQGLREALSR